VRRGAIIPIACTVAPGLNGQPRGPGSVNCIGFEGIVDGTANTILFGEKRLNVRVLFGNRGDDNEGYTAGLDQDTIRYTDLIPRPDRIDNSATGPTGAIDGEWRFGSSHPASFSVVMCDGAVKSISYRIEAIDESTEPLNTALPPAPPVYTGNISLFNRLGVRDDGIATQLP
jgi:hypothetical protein